MSSFVFRGKCFKDYDQHCGIHFNFLCLVLCLVKIVYFEVMENKKMNLNRQNLAQELCQPKTQPGCLSQLFVKYLPLRGHGRRPRRGQK